ncbi:hypothetical protein ACLKA7_002817 [Drosophila subpalustris]
MPRAKVTKKQTVSELPATNGNAASSSVATEDISEVADAIKQPPKSKVRGKKAAAAAAAVVVSDGQDMETVVAKKTTSRSKKKLADDELKETLPTTNDKEASTSSTVSKSKSRAKKTPAPEGNGAQEVDEVQVVAKKTAARGKRKSSEEPVEIAKSEPVKPKGRAKQPATDKKEITPAPIEPAASKGRGKKEKAIVRAEDTAAPTKNPEPKARARKIKEPEQAEDSEVVPAKERAKKEVKETAAKGKAKKVEAETTASTTVTKRARGTKRLADTEITEIMEADGEPEQELEPEVKPASKKTAKQKKTSVENVEVPAKKRGKKVANEESQPLKQEVKEEEEEVPAPSKKRAPKRANDQQNADPTALAPVSKPARGRKRAAAGAEDDGDALAVSEADGSTTSKVKKAATVKAEAPAAGSYDKSQFPVPTEKEFNLKISSWNVAGLRAWLKKDGLKFVEFEEPDIFCLQETKCVNDQLPDEMTRLPGYHPYWLCMPGGYAGVAVYSKIMPINVEYGIGNEEFDDVGRIITAEYEKFFLINVYVPNSGRKLVNLEPRMRWEKLFQAYVQKLDALKPVVICGDMNVSHLEIDLANPKSNIRNAGFTKEERDKMTELLALGYVDTFRHLYPTRTGAYSYWTYMANARSRNIGWRLDYCIVSERLVSRVVDNVMRSHCLGSDHCPITVFLNI